MRLLLTGSTGFLGRNLLLRLLENPRGYDKIYLPIRNSQKLIDQLKEEGYSTLPRNIEVIKGEAPTWTFDPIEVDHVVHSAGVLFAPNQAGYFETNVEGTCNLLDRIRGASKILILSSQAATGPCESNQESKNEKDADHPVTWYGLSKLEMEKQLKEKYSHLPYLCLRPPMVLGARDSATLPLFKMAKQPFQFKPGKQHKHYSFVGVDDLVGAILSCLQSQTDWSTLPYRHFYVANPGTITDSDLILTAVKVSGRQPRLIPVPQAIVRMASEVIDRIPPWRKAVPTLTRDRAREIWPARWVVSSQEFMKTFGWRPQENLENVLASTFAWYHSHGLI